MNQTKNQGARAISEPQMSDKINDIAWQAHQGSVAAIIQVLNERLVKSGVRTRAVFSDDVLQLLCEAATVEQLEQSILVEKIREILESIAPRHIRKVNINSRLVREEQLLWLEEINRDRQNQLLWSQEIILSQPSFWQQLIQNFQTIYHELEQPISPKSQSLLNFQSKQQNSTKRLIIASTILCTIIVIHGLNDIHLFSIFKNLISLEISFPVNTEESPQSQVLSTAIKTSNQATNNTPQDSFSEAVRIANQAAVIGKTAITKTQWLELAAQWQKASDLMSQVPPSHHRYEAAQIRVKLYREYSKNAQKAAERMSVK